MKELKKPNYPKEVDTSLAERVFEDFNGPKNTVCDIGEWQILELNKRNLYLFIGPSLSRHGHCTDYPASPYTIVAGFEIPRTLKYTKEGIPKIGVSLVPTGEREKIKGLLGKIALGPINFWD